MKKIIVLVALIFCCSMVWAGEKEELTLKKENLELQLNSIQLTAQLMQLRATELQGKLKATTEKLQELAKKDKKDSDVPSAGH